ncbi:MAG: hypothetical protein KH380_02035 [Coprobacillus sp.]|nr:hypothetical protein [Coprobacillus sp.]
MKKISFLMLSFALSMCLGACGGTTRVTTTANPTTSSSTTLDSTTSSNTTPSSSTTPSVSTSEINPLDGFTVTAVAGVEVKDSCVTLTQSQYDALLLSPEKNCEYKLSNGVQAVISVEGNQLIFDLTSPSGTTARYVITLTVLSNRTDINIKTIYNKQVVDGKVTLSESEYASLLNLQDYDSVCDYQSSDGSTVQISFDKPTHKLIFNVLSQDGTKTNEVKVEVNVTLPFGTHSLTGVGDKKYVTYDYENLFYSLNGSAAVTDEKGKNLKGSYAFSAQIYPQSLTQGNEVVLSAVYADNYQIRFALRGVDESHYLIFSDYKDRSNFLNYIEHVSSTEYNQEKGVNMGLVVVDGSVVMMLDGEVIYRRALPELNYTEMFLSTYECTAHMKNLQIESDEAKVKSMYQNALIDYKDKLTGVSLINTSQNISEFVENVDGKIYVEGKDSDQRVMGALYQNGVPVGGYEYAISGHLKINDTKTTGGKASKVELQIAKNVQNFVKFHIFRYPTNNSIYAYPTENGKAASQVICENNTLPKGTEYQADYIFVYSGKELKMYFKDGSYLTNYKLVYSQEANWGYTMFTLAMRQYCNVTFDNFKTYYGDDFDALVNSLEDSTTPAEDVKFSAEKDTFRDNGCFTNGNTGTYYKTESAYDKAFIFKDNKAVSGEYWLTSGRMQFGEYAAWTQGELSAYVDATHAIRYVFEYTGSYYQVFHEIKNGNDNWTGYTLIVRPQVKNDATMNFTLVNYGGKISLLINGYVYHTVEFEFLKNATATIGGKGGTLVLKNITINTNKVDIENFTSNMEEYTYVSPYDSRMNSLAKQYESAEKGGVLIMGSSTMDYWKDWQTDIGGRLGYNVGIGGTIVEDWLYAYDKLVKPFNPSIIIIFLGGNNINNMGHTGAYARSLMEKLLNKMHEDFPDAEIYYIYSMAVPSCYKGGKFNYEYGQFIDEMKELVANTEWLNGIDTFDDLTRDGEAKKELYRPDGIHLNEDGYDVFAEIINRNIFNKK